MTQKRQNRRQALLVVGMHRSGTSALTRVLNLHGADLGSDLLAAAEDNQAGFWENRRIVAFHEKLLSLIGSSWDDLRQLRADWLDLAIANGCLDELIRLLDEEFASSGTWVVKDPRLCRFLPLWIRALGISGVEPKLVFAMRDPGEVAGSLMKRNGLSAGAATLLWLEYLAESVQASRGLPRCAIDYHELLQDWRSCVDRIATSLDVTWPVSSSDCAPEITAHLQEDLRHQRADHARDLLPPEWRDLLLSTYRAAKSQVCDSDDWEGLAKVLEGAMGHFEFMRPLMTDFEPASLKKQSQSRLAEAERARAAYQSEAERLQVEYGEADRRLAEAERSRREAELRSRELELQKMEAEREWQQLRGALQLALDNSRQVVDHKNHEIERLSGQIQSMGELRRATETRIESLGLQIDGLNARLAEREKQLGQIISSHSWRLTAPLRAARRLGGRVIRLSRHVVSSISHVLTDGESRSRYWTLAKQLGLLGALRRSLHFVRRGGPSPAPSVPVEHTFNLRRADGKPIVILSTPHCRFVAEEIAHALDQVGIASNIIHEIPAGGYADVPHFVICPQMFDSMPALHVSFQMEQSVSSRWFTREYLRRLESSYAIFDYSLDNIASLAKKGLHPKQFYYMPVGYLPGYGSDLEPAMDSYDVLFYGDINNARRRTCIHELEKICRVKVVSNLFGRDMLQELCKAKIVVNIHYYPGALLESTRLWECLSLGRLVVSERGSDMPMHEDLESLIDFVDEGDFVGMADRVRYWLEHEGLRREKLARNAERMKSMFRRFDYFFYRFLLATDNIGFADFWRLIGESFPLASDRLCLNLPEYLDRSASFDRDNHFGFQRFPGLRHAKGWLGCAMSYKYMLRLARKHGLPQVTICEDDVDFPTNFETVWGDVKEALAKDTSRWDIFSGVLADLSADTNVLEVEELGERKLVMIDRLISMVFNVYNASCYDLIDAWDERNHDVLINTIDRFLERQGQLRVMTTSPFLVGHKEDLHSTLWGAQNTIYSELMSKSAELLQEKVDAWGQ
jgi:hypothetical protein